MLQFIRTAVKSVTTKILMYAIKTDRMRLGKLAIFMGADVNMEIYSLHITNYGYITHRDRKCGTPLTCAIFHKNIKWIDLLVKNGANINAEIMYGLVSHTTPLFHAIELHSSEQNMISIIDLLLKLGANINHTANIIYTRNVFTDDTYVKRTPLLHAIYTQNLDLLKLLIAHKADLNLTLDCYVPLFEAMGTGNIDIVKLLIQNGVNLDIKRIDGKTPLMLAMDNVNPADDNSLYMVKLLRNADKARPIVPMLARAIQKERNKNNGVVKNNLPIDMLPHELIRRVKTMLTG